MTTSHVKSRLADGSHGDIAGGIARSAGRAGWQLVRIPVFAFLTIIGPLVRIVLSVAALVGVVTAFLFEFSGVAPRFPFWGVLGLSVGCAVLLLAYNALMRVMAT